MINLVSKNAFNFNNYWVHLNSNRSGTPPFKVYQNFDKKLQKNDFQR